MEDNNVQLATMTKTKTKKSTKTKTSRSNKAVQGTNDNSIVSKWSMSKKGYFVDQFLSAFIISRSRDFNFRSPIINRGYWIRAFSVNRAMATFFDFYNKQIIPTQVISLGAGYDSTFFRLTNAGQMLAGSCYIEVDFRELLSKKLEMIRKNEMLSKFLDSSSCQQLDENPYIVFRSPNYVLVGIDLKNVQQLNEALKLLSLDFKKPTLLLSEVVLTYLDPTSSSNVIQWAADTFENALFLTYEQVNNSDAFGNFMCEHFRKLGSPLKSIDSFSSIQSQVKRYRDLGWTETVASDLNYFYNNVVPPSEHARIEALEPFDEYEEWHLKCEHYILLTAARGSAIALKDDIWSENVRLSPQVCRNEISQTPVVLESNGLRVSSCATLSLSTTSMSDAKSTRVVCSLLPVLKNWCRRYGHTSTILKKDAVVVVGGFGCSDDGSHRRVVDANVVFFDDLSVSLSLPLFERLYHSTTTVGDGRLVVFGGRTSPARSTSDVSVLEFGVAKENSCGSVEGLDVAMSWRNVQETTSGEKPSPRWRHSAASYDLEGRPTLVVFGGRNVLENFLDDCWFLDCETWRWTKFEGHGHLPCARHTHTSEVWRNGVLIICGLGSGEIPLNSIHFLDMTTHTWHPLPLVGDLVPRYSHTSAVHGDRLILIGGISFSHSFHPVVVIDLASLTFQNFKLPEQEPEYLMMLHNHSCIRIDEDENKITLIVIGGGGNCFSFGTHLNSRLMSLTI